MKSKDSKILVKNEPLTLRHKKGFGAWTYHIVIPNTADIQGKWGDLKVSGKIDNYILETMNLAPRKNEDKIISINKTIRKAINKFPGDILLVSLYLHEPQKPIHQNEILSCFKDAAVLEEFNRLEELKQGEIIAEIQNTSESNKQAEKINYFIEYLFQLKDNTNLNLL